MAHSPIDVAVDLSPDDVAIDLNNLLTHHQLHRVVEVNPLCSADIPGESKLQNTMETDWKQVV